MASSVRHKGADSVFHFVNIRQGVGVTKLISSVMSNMNVIKSIELLKIKIFI